MKSDITRRAQIQFMEFDQDLAARQNESSHPKPFGTNLQNGKKIMKRTNEQTNKQTNKQKKKTINAIGP